MNKLKKSVEKITQAIYDRGEDFNSVDYDNMTDAILTLIDSERRKAIEQYAAIQEAVRGANAEQRQTVMEAERKEVARDILDRIEKANTIQRGGYVKSNAETKEVIEDNRVYGPDSMIVSSEIDRIRKNYGLTEGGGE